MRLITRWLRRVLRLGPRYTGNMCWDLGEVIAEIKPFDTPLMREFRGLPATGIVHHWVPDP
jgi:hypothetical protein